METDPKTIPMKFQCIKRPTNRFLTENTCNERILNARPGDITTGECYLCPGPIPIPKLIEKKEKKKAYDKKVKYSDGKVCDDCGKPITNQNISKLCQKCFRERNKGTWKIRKDTTVKIPCKGENCDKMVKKYNVTGLCITCFNKSKAKKKPVDTITKETFREILKPLSTEEFVDKGTEELKKMQEKDKPWIADSDTKVIPSPLPPVTLNMDAIAKDVKTILTDALEELKITKEPVKIDDSLKLTIDFSEHPKGKELLDKLKRTSKKDFRSLNEQILFLINNIHEGNF